MSLSAWSSNVPHCGNCRAWSVPQGPDGAVRWCEVLQGAQHARHWCPEWRPRGGQPPREGRQDGARA